MNRQTKNHHCDIAIIGGSMGSVAAALTALEQGYKVILTEATDWLGGQMTSQGVSAFDEHPHIERLAAREVTESYANGFVKIIKKNMVLRQ
jgi:NADPH-dependent 2,4-dienoyl-CoA reductase/sulfur reductase-like enzyme